jgi:hypothetical protein
MRGQFALHGVDPLISLDPLPPRGLHRPDHSLAASVHMNVFHRDLLLTFAAVSVERIEQRGGFTGCHIAVRDRSSNGSERGHRVFGGPYLRQPGGDQAIPARRDKTVLPVNSDACYGCRAE